MKLASTEWNRNKDEGKQEKIKQKCKKFFYENSKKENIQFKHENVIELVLVTLQNGIQMGKRFLKKKLGNKPCDSNTKDTIC